MNAREGTPATFEPITSGTRSTLVDIVTTAAVLIPAIVWYRQKYLRLEWLFRWPW